ncbi:restriction endonuclease subunit S [Staphylococcus equorum]|uniref:restriction endonuclease subunit S n=1 Tax=Staphylococcus equorum TaxID=246432 RepID=UPI003D800997
MTEIANTPELRFPNYENSWFSYKLNDISERVTRKNKNLESQRPLTISGQLGLIDQIEYFNKSVSSKNLTGYTLIKKGEFAYNKSYSNGYPLGAIKKLERYDLGILSSLYICFSFDENIDKSFMKNYFESTKWYREVANIAVEGARNHGLLNIPVNDFFNININLPIQYEQEKIGEFFSKLDRQIELEEQKLAKLEEQKKGYMQKIFSQTLRFKDEEDNVYPDWIRTKLINIVTPLKGQDDNITNFPILTISASRGWLNQKERFSQVIAGNSLKKYTQVKKNDLSYNKGNSKVAKYGIVFRLKNEALVPNVYKSFRPNENIDSIFIEKYFHNKTLDKQLRTRITSTARTDGLLNISDQDFYDIKLYIPILQEQTKIADFLNKLDKLIEKQSSKIILLKHRKKGLLQKMFV